MGMKILFIVVVSILAQLVLNQAKSYNFNILSLTYPPGYCKGQKAKGKPCN